MMKRIASIITIFILLITSINSTMAETTFEYKDIDDKAWYYEDVMLSRKLGLMIGRTYYNFDPEGKVTVAEAITVASRVLNNKLPELKFSWNNSTIWYDNYIEYAIKNGIVHENEFTNFDTNITRKDVATLFSRVINKIGYTVINEVACIPDVSIKDDIYDDVISLYEAGILWGNDTCGTFSPEKEITRAEIASIINRMCIDSRRVENTTLEEQRYWNVKSKIQSDTNNNLFVSSSNFNVSQELVNKLQAEIDYYGGNCAFYLVTLDGSLSIGYNIDKSFESASTVKAPYTLYAFKQIDSGNGSFEDIMTYKSYHTCAGSGEIQYAKYGTQYTLDEIFHKVIHISDNTAYYMLQEKYPIDAYNEFMTSIDCSKMRLQWGARWGTVNARDAVKIWNELYHYINTSKYGDKLWNLVVNADFNFIKDSLVAKYGTLKYDVAHKSGFNPSGRHDEAIVLDKKPYILVVCTQPNGKQNAYLKNITLILHQIMEEYAAYVN